MLRVGLWKALSIYRNRLKRPTDVLLINTVEKSHPFSRREPLFKLRPTLPVNLARKQIPLRVIRKNVKIKRWRHVRNIL